MTFDELKTLVYFLSNSCGWVRHWRCYDGSFPDCKQFAIQVKDYFGKEKEIPDLELRDDFIRIDPEWIYVFRKDAL